LAEKGQWLFLSMSKKQYAYQNLLLEYMEGEKWEDVPGLGAYFMISNLGTLKRLELDFQCRNCAIYAKPDIIIKPIIVRQPNRFVGDSTHFLTVKVGLSGKRYNSLTLKRSTISSTDTPCLSR